MHGNKADAKRKMGLYKWSKLPGPHTLNIAEGHPSFKLKIEVKLEGKIKNSKKRKIEKGEGKEK